MPITAQTQPGNRRRTGGMDSYNSVSMYRNSRHDSFHRELAEDLSRRHPESSADVTGSVENLEREPPFNWMRRGLARVRSRIS